MSIAELKGKLTPSEESAEDLLTSEVFGALELLGYAWLRGWLSGAIAPLAEGRPTLSSSLPGSGTPSVSIQYWPWIESVHKGVPGCEPDVVLQVGDQLLIVEMKYWSAKSGAGLAEEELSPGQRDLRLADQLGREWFAGKTICEKPGHLSGIERVGNWAVVYVTQGHSAPLPELRESLESVCRIVKIGREEVAGRLYWTNYQSLYAALMRRAAVFGPACTHETRISEHLSALLAYKGLVPFMGFESCQPSGLSNTLSWRFDVEGGLPWLSTREIPQGSWLFRPPLFGDASGGWDPRWKEMEYDFFEGGTHEDS